MEPKSCSKQSVSLLIGGSFALDRHLLEQILHEFKRVFVDSRCRHVDRLGALRGLDFSACEIERQEPVAQSPRRNAVVLVVVGDVLKDLFCFNSVSALSGLEELLILDERLRGRLHPVVVAKHRPHVEGF